MRVMEFESSSKSTTGISRIELIIKTANSNCSSGSCVFLALARYNSSVLSWERSDACFPGRRCDGLNSSGRLAVTWSVFGKVVLLVRGRHERQIEQMDEMQAGYTSGDACINCSCLHYMSMKIMNMEQMRSECTNNHACMDCSCLHDMDVSLLHPYCNLGTPGFLRNMQIYAGMIMGTSAMHALAKCMEAQDFGQGHCSSSQTKDLASEECRNPDVLELPVQIEHLPCTLHLRAIHASGICFLRQDAIFYLLFSFQT